MLKLATFILAALLIVQRANALPAPENAPATITDMRQLVENAAETYIEFFGYATEMYRQLFEKVLELSHKEAETDPELQTALRPFIDYVKKLHGTWEKSRETLQNFFEESTQLADKYDRGVPVGSSAADKKIAKYMNEAQAMKTKFDILMKYINSLQLFANNVRKYLNSLSEEERQHQKKLKTWYINWQREHNWEKKNDLMMNFFELLDNTKDDRTKLTDRTLRNFIIYLNAVVTARKNLLSKTVKAIEAEIKDRDDDIEFALNVLKGFVERAEKLPEKSEKERLVELAQMYGAAEELRERYKKTDEIPESEQQIAKILNKNGEMDVEVREVLLTFGVTEEVVKDVEEYLDTRHDADKEMEGQLREWFENVQNETDLLSKVKLIFHLIEILDKSRLD